jgi:A/G-specific adenine glycosylase
VSPARALLAWYDRHRRDLPWRADRHPYPVWLSEVMLQQTRVDVVAPYYRRFLARFPTVEALAAAEIDEVLGLWSGLGYYRRARQLHAAARRMAAGGGFPRTAAGLGELPGIGAYTAAAVASIAFGERVPALDGNSERVLTRRLALAGDPRRAAGRRALAAAALELLDPERPGDGNQALMELGATVCTPRRPACPRCPLAPGCAARAAGEPERWPPPRRRRAVERRRLGVAVVSANGRTLLFRRPDDSPLLAGTWELPWFELAPEDDPAAAGPPALDRRYGGRWHLGPHLAAVRHGITHRAFVVEAHGARVEDEDESVAEGPEAGWFSDAERANLPLSSLVTKVLSATARATTGGSRTRAHRRAGRRPDSGEGPPQDRAPAGRGA